MYCTFRVCSNLIIWAIDFTEQLIRTNHYINENYKYFNIFTLSTCVRFFFKFLNYQLSNHIFSCNFRFDSWTRIKSEISGTRLISLQEREKTYYRERRRKRAIYWISHTHRVSASPFCAVLFTKFLLCVWGCTRNVFYTVKHLLSRFDRKSIRLSRWRAAWRSLMPSRSSRTPLSTLCVRAGVYTSLHTNIILLHIFSIVFY